MLPARVSSGSAKRAGQGRNIVTVTSFVLIVYATERSVSLGVCNADDEMFFPRDGSFSAVLPADVYVHLVVGCAASTAKE